LFPLQLSFSTLCSLTKVSCSVHIFWPIFHLLVVSFVVAASYTRRLISELIIVILKVKSCIC
jgi:hypothetical protein